MCANQQNDKMETYLLFKHEQKNKEITKGCTWQHAVICLLLSFSETLRGLLIFV